MNINWEKLEGVCMIKVGLFVCFSMCNCQSRKGKSHPLSTLNFQIAGVPKLLLFSFLLKYSITINLHFLWANKVGQLFSWRSQRSSSCGITMKTSQLVAIILIASLPVLFHVSYRVKTASESSFNWSQVFKWSSWGETHLSAVLLNKHLVSNVICNFI